MIGGDRGGWCTGTTVRGRAGGLRRLGNDVRAGGLFGGWVFGEIGDRGCFMEVVRGLMGLGMWIVLILIALVRRRYGGNGCIWRL